MIYPVSRLYYSFSDMLHGSNALGYFRLYRHYEKFSPEKIRSIQTRRLNELLGYAGGHSVYYKALFKECGLKNDGSRSLDDIRKLPILTRDLIESRSDHLKCRGVNFQVESSHTGGSTGKPLHFLLDKRQPGLTLATLWRSWSWGGWKPGARYTDLWGAWRDVSSQERTRARIRNSLENHQFLNAANLTDDSLKDFARAIQDFRPVMLRGYAQAIYLLAEYVNEHKIDNISPKCVVTSGEQLFDWQRPAIKQAFGVDVMDGYGCRESSVMASECSYHEGYHISDENGIMEFVDDEGEPVGEGELGRILITDFHNWAMPFFRYEVGDMGRPTDHRCSCGRGLSMMTSIEGRITDFIVTPDNRFILGTGMSQSFWKMKTVERAIIIQERISELEIKVIPGKGFGDTDKELIEKEMRRYVGEDMKIHIRTVKDIPMGPSGKRRSAISKVRVRF